MTLTLPLFIQQARLFVALLAKFGPPRASEAGRISICDGKDLATHCRQL
jgi:hypothetical protein